MSVRGLVRAYRYDSVLTWRIWKSTWFPIRMAEFIGERATQTTNTSPFFVTTTTTTATVSRLDDFFGPMEWHPPMRGPLKALWPLLRKVLR